MKPRKCDLSLISFSYSNKYRRLIKHIKLFYNIILIDNEHLTLRYDNNR